MLLSAAYLAVGVFILYRQVMEQSMLNYALGGLFILYGGWRMYRALLITE